MNIKEYLDWENEKPLDRLVEGYSHTSVFRKIAFIGDSLSSGEFETRDKDGKPGYHDLYDYSWGQYIARKNGLTAYNFSKGGMTAKEYIESFAEDRGFWDKEKACQAYVIALGVNDIYCKNMELGDVTDAGTDKPTFMRYYMEIIKRYKEISPDAKFFFVTFPHPDTDEKNEKALAVRDALYNLAENTENAYVIDLYEYVPVYDDSVREKFFLYGHMSPSGYIFTAIIIDSYIDYIVRHNPDDFKTVGFIGTDIEYKKR